MEEFDPLAHILTQQPNNLESPPENLNREWAIKVIKEYLKQFPFDVNDALQGLREDIALVRQEQAQSETDTATAFTTKAGKGDNTDITSLSGLSSDFRTSFLGYTDATLFRTGANAADPAVWINAAISAVSTAGGGVVQLPPLRLEIYSQITLRENVRLRGHGPGVTVLVQRGDAQVIGAVGSRGGAAATGTLAADAPSGSRHITLNTGQGVRFAQGNWILVRAENTPFAGNVQKAGQIVLVEDVVGDALTLDKPLSVDFLVSNSAGIDRLNLMNNVAIEDLSVEQFDETLINRGLIGIIYCYRASIKNVDARKARQAALGIIGSVRTRVTDFRPTDLVSDTAANYLGYGINEAGANRSTFISGVQSERVRHAYTTNNSSSVLPYGGAEGTRAVAIVADSCLAAGIDTHPQGNDIEFIGCFTNGSKHAGFQIRSRNTTITGGGARDCTAPGLFIWHTAADTVVSGFVCDRTNLGTDAEGLTWTSRGALCDLGTNSQITGATARNCGGPGLEQAPEAVNSIYEGIKVFDPCRITTTVKYGIWSSSTAATSLTIRSPTVRCSDTRMDIGVYSPSGNISAWCENARVSGAQIADVDVNANNPASVYGAGLVSLGPNTGATVAGDATTPGTLSLARSPGRGAVLSLTGSDPATAQTINSIDGLGSGAVIVLRRGGTGAITLATGGNLLLRGNVSAVLDGATKAITLFRHTTNWVELSRNF